MTNSDTDYTVRADPELDPVERQFSFHLNAEMTHFRVYCDQPGPMNRLLSHPDWNIKPDRRVDGNVVAVRGTIPVGYLSAGTTERKSDSIADIIPSSVLSNE